MQKTVISLIKCLAIEDNSWLSLTSEISPVNLLCMSSAVQRGFDSLI